MSTLKQNSDTEKASSIITEKDVLGQEKSTGLSSPAKAKPGRIFIIVGLLAAAAIIYWLVKH